MCLNLSRHLQIVAVLSTVPSASFASKATFLKEIKQQAIDLESRSGINYEKVNLSYRILGRLLYGIGRDNFLNYFDSISKESAKCYIDKRTAVRGLGWFVLAVIFMLISIFIN